MASRPTSDGGKSINLSLRIVLVGVFATEKLSTKLEFSLPNMKKFSVELWKSEERPHKRHWKVLRQGWEGAGRETLFPCLQPRLPRFREKKVQVRQTFQASAAVRWYTGTDVRARESVF